MNTSSPVLSNPQMFENLWRFSKCVVDARMYPDLASPQAAFVIMTRGLELGVEATDALEHVRLDRGKLILSAAIMSALAIKAGVAVQPLEKTARGAKVKLSRVVNGETLEHIETFDEAMAKRAGLLGRGTWQKYPEAMYWARCISAATRTFCPDATMGAYVPGEISQELEPMTADRAQREAEAEVADALGPVGEKPTEDFTEQNMDAFERAALPKKKKKAKPEPAPAETHDDPSWEQTTMMGAPQAGPAPGEHEH